MIFLLFIPFIVFSQNNLDKYRLLTQYIQDSIINTNDYFISENLANGFDFGDFHGMSSQCDIQHYLLVEIITNGVESNMSEAKFSSIIPNHLKEKSRNYRIRLSNVISYNNIWGAIIEKEDLSLNLSSVFNYLEISR